MILQGRSYAPGAISGEALVLTAPLSFYGGVDPNSGIVIDRTHPEQGASMAGRILVLPGGRGSSSSSSVLAEAIRLGTAPLAIVLERPDAIMVIAAIVGQRLYSVALPIMTCPIGSIRDGDRLDVICRTDGTATIQMADL
jgi:predicted aconitase with swiveling domain